MPVEAVAALAAGDLEVIERMPWASNATFLGRLVESDTLVVYKPCAGERPLWDFPSGSLAGREVAAFEVSAASGWDIVPPTVMRDGPFGPGMVQLFVDHDPDEHYLELRDRYADRFREFAAFDVVVNNADRKAGHCLLDGDGHVWGIDHGVTFHVHHKLRTVIWDFAGEALADSVRDGLERIGREVAAGELRARLATLLHGMEIDALGARVAAVLEDGVMPFPQGDYPYPWPLI